MTAAKEPVKKSVGSFRQPHRMSETTGNLVTQRELLAKQNSPFSFWYFKSLKLA